MRIIQSYWSLPSRINNENDGFGRSNGGWLTEKYHAMSWALSCLKFRQFYDDVELYTDNSGQEWLINKLGLPYSKITVTTEKYNCYDPSLWALPKLNTFLQQDDPFLHADGDVFIWKAFDDTLFECPLIVQNVEYDVVDNISGNLYIDTLRMLEQNSAFFPDFLKPLLDNFKSTKRIDAFNMGVVGGRHTNFFKDYANQVFDFLDKNKEIKFSGRDMNFIEQFILYCLAKKYQLQETVLFEEENAVSLKGYAKLTQFNVVPINQHFIHVVGSAKQRIIFCNQVALRLSYEFPVMYQHILNLYQDKPEKHFINRPKPQYQSNLKINFIESFKLIKNMGEDYEDGSFEGFLQLIDKLKLENKNPVYLKRLNDSWQFENFLFTMKHEYHEGRFNTTEQKRISLLKHLYESSAIRFLELKFTLNTPFVEVFIVNFRYPTQFSINNVNNIIQSAIKETGIPDLLLVTVSNDEIIETKVINGSDMLLTFFDNEQISGNELIELIKNNKMQNKILESNLNEFVLSFLTHYSIYYNYLILV